MTTYNILNTDSYPKTIGSPLTEKNCHCKINHPCGTLETLIAATNDYISGYIYIYYIIYII